MKKGKSIHIHLSNKLFYTIILMMGICVLGVGVIAYTTDGSGNPAVAGHSADELEEADPTVIASVKDGVDWTEVTNIPSDIADGDDVGGGGSCSVTGHYSCYRITGVGSASCISPYFVIAHDQFAGNDGVGVTCCIPTITCS